MYHLRKRSRTLVPDRSFAAVLRSYSHNVDRTERSVARGTSASLLLDLPHARYHNHLINLLLLLRILTHGCVCMRVRGALDFPPSSNVAAFDRLLYIFLTIGTYRLHDFAFVSAVKSTAASLPGLSLGPPLRRE